jgi:small multidrug resistance pump
MRHWLYLAMAIVLEVAGTTSMKLSHGFERLGPSILIFVFYGLSFAAIGIVVFRESVTLVKLASIGLIIVGVIGLNLSDARH